MKHNGVLTFGLKNCERVAQPRSYQKSQFLWIPASSYGSPASKLPEVPVPIDSSQFLCPGWLGSVWGLMFGARSSLRHSEAVGVYGQIRLHSGNIGVPFMRLMFGAEEQPKPLRGR